MVGLTNGKRPRIRETNEDRTNKERRDPSARTDSEGSSSHESEDEQDDEPQPQESFADRLKILKIHDSDQPGKSNGIRVPVSSLAQTLVQALNSSDTKLLETCLLQSNKPLIANTIQRIPTPLVHNLIEQLIICLNKKKRGAGEGATASSVRRTKILIEWVRQLLLVHMSYLLTIPSLVSKLTNLHTSLQKRLNLHSKLLALNGRLELVLNQIERNKSGASHHDFLEPINSTANGIQTKQAERKRTKAVETRPPLKYVEGESTDDEQMDEDEKLPNGEIGSDEQDDDSDKSDEGSIEDVVLGSESDSDEEEGSSEDDTSRRKGRGRGKLNVSEELFDLEAELSGSGLDDDDDEDEDEDEDDDDDLDDFIDDGTDDDSDNEGESD